MIELCFFQTMCNRVHFWYFSCTTIRKIYHNQFKRMVLVFYKLLFALVLKFVPLCYQTPKKRHFKAWRKSQKALSPPKIFSPFNKVLSIWRNNLPQSEKIYSPLKKQSSLENINLNNSRGFQDILAFCWNRLDSSLFLCIFSWKRIF